MPADDKKLDQPSTPPAKAEAPAFKKGDVIGELDGEPIVVGTHVDEKGVPIEQKATEASLAEWHAAFTKHRDVELETPAYRSSTGILMPKQIVTKAMPSIRCVVAHRVVHSLSPKQREEALKLIGKSDAPESALLQLVAESDLMQAGGKDHPAVPHWHPATQDMIEMHAHPSRLAKHHAELAKKSAAPTS